jgi:hypothetical protein
LVSVAFWMAMAARFAPIAAAAMVWSGTRLHDLGDGRRLPSRLKERFVMMTKPLHWCIPSFLDRKPPQFRNADCEA